MAKRTQARIESTSFRTFRLGRIRLEADARIPRSFLEEIWAAPAAEGHGRVRFVPLSPAAGEGEAAVKTYRVRRPRALLRRLRAGRAAREGAGYLAFAERGIVTVPLLFWGEERHLGLLVRGIVATGRVAAVTVAEAAAERQEPGLIEAALEVLVRIHRAGLAHGDPCLRNFLATRPHPTPLDLPTWSPLSGSSARRDLVRFLGSAVALQRDEDVARSLLERYESRIPELPADRETLLEEAREYGRRKGRP